MKQALAILALAATSATFATATSAQGVYVFGDLGQSDFDLGSAPGFSVDETDTMYGIGVGYSFNDYFSAELGYVDLGESTISTNAPISGTVFGSSFSIDGKFAIDATGVFFGVRGDLPVSDSIDLFARAGMLHWQSDASFSGTITIDGDTFTSGSGELDDGTDPYLGLGASYAFNDNVSVNAQWNRYMLDMLGEDLDIDTLSVGLAYRF
ncbi:hypothetical protein GCM10011352_39350 [Marinobacterium zhoushanense]|uniref:Outer membrane protein beta-barrel domain-containing protein n=1 Tax=Marinobacterium zhoushanense TaxID=1679163 RepID=A0ABQ1KSR0_9GAMM|nr:outer membrane beta-barrel protein [Marinobacterium zhoushanense]GGC09116.1 hypothetical protein GCM10011352_39350 [Marinobacterium zhoushanense]